MRAKQRVARIHLRQLLLLTDSVLRSAVTGECVWSGQSWRSRTHVYAGHDRCQLGSLVIEVCPRPLPVAQRCILYVYVELSRVVMVGHAHTC